MRAALLLVCVLSLLVATVEPVAAAAAPSVTQLSRHAGSVKGGQTLTVTGTDLTGAKRVLFGTARGTRLRIASPTSLTVVTPKHAAGTVTVRVVTRAGSSRKNAATAFTFGIRPVVTAVSPRLLPQGGGTRVVLTGRNLKRVRQVMFGTTPGTRLVIRSGTRLSVTAPPHPSGRVAVRAVNRYGRSPATAPTKVIYRVKRVSSLVARPAQRVVQLAWLNPPDAGFDGVTIRRAIGLRPPKTITQGTRVANLRPSQSTFSDTGLTVKTTYAYSVFAIGGPGNDARTSVVTRTSNKAGPGPVLQPNAAVVTADALPTAQIDGVGWTQVVVGRTVYVGGSFTTARPYGAASGEQTVPRSNMLAYDLITGRLNPTFAPEVNGQVLSLAASPDGKRLYLGGMFTRVDGKKHVNIAAVSTATGRVVKGWNARVNDQVRAVVATASTVYIGGDFSAVGGTARARVAALTAARGQLTRWRPPVLGGYVYAMVLTPDRKKVVIGGNYSKLDGTTVRGIGAVDSTTGKLLPWLLNKRLQNYGNGSVVNSLSTDGVSVFGAGYNFGSNKKNNYEGAWSANPANGSINWMEDCHGDTYSVFGVNGVVYTAGHSHSCRNAGGFLNRTPYRIKHTLAWTAKVTGRLKHNPPSPSYQDFGGLPSPSYFQWEPDYTIGSYTGLNQAVWHVTGTKKYLVAAGEFVEVNGQAQQGLTRFALRGTRGNPGAQPPALPAADLAPTLTAQGSSVTIAFPRDFDIDDILLTYRLYRDGTLLWSRRYFSLEWRPGTITVNDTGLKSGTTYTYRVSVTDPHGKSILGDPAEITTP